MKKTVLLILISLTFTFFTLAQKVTVSFQPKNDSDKIDSVHVTNLTKGQTVKLDATETIVFTPPTFINHVALEGTDNGYLYPNPFNESTTLVFNTSESQEVLVSIYTISGQSLYSKLQKLPPGNHKFQLQFPASGLYNVVVLENKYPLSYKAVYMGENLHKFDIQYIGSEKLVNSSNKLNQLKSARNEKSLDYSNGDVVHYIVYSGENTTVIADAPTTSKTIEVEFYECKDPDNRSYNIVQIGNQWWMAENLAYLPSVTGPDSGSYVVPCYYLYGYSGTDINAAKSTANYAAYGVLYNWPAAMDGQASSTANPSGVQGVCPTGWHLPSDAEWTELTNYLGGVTVAGDKLKETDTTHWNSPNIGATNETGFTALPGGRRNYDEIFINIGSFGYWWSASEDGTYGAWSLRMNYLYSNVAMYSEGRAYGLSVRCLRD